MGNCADARSGGSTSASGVRGLSLLTSRFVVTPAALRGYLLEEALAWLLRGSGYRLIPDAAEDPFELVVHAGALHVRGRGAMHQVDVLGELLFTPAFSLPVRLFLEAKFTGRCGLQVVRNAHGVLFDVNENYAAGAGGGGPRGAFVTTTPCSPRAASRLKPRSTRSRIRSR